MAAINAATPYPIPTIHSKEKPMPEPTPVLPSYLKPITAPDGRVVLPDVYLDTRSMEFAHLPPGQLEKYDTPLVVVDDTVELQLPPAEMFSMLRSELREGVPPVPGFYIATRRDRPLTSLCNHVRLYGRNRLHRWVSVTEELAQWMNHMDRSMRRAIAGDNSIYDPDPGFAWAPLPDFARDAFHQWCEANPSYLPLSPRHPGYPN